MKAIAITVILVVGALGWRAGTILDATTVAIAVGVFFGVMAPIPMVLLVMYLRTPPASPQPEPEPPHVMWILPNPYHVQHKIEERDTWLTK